MLNKLFLVAAASLSVFSCSTLTKTSMSRQSSNESLLFPSGKYMQSADAHIKTPKGDQNFDFNAVVKKNESEILFYGYSSFGLTLFKIHQNKEDPVQIESSIAEINKNKEFFIQIFFLVKQIFYLQVSNPNYKDQKIHFTLDRSEADVQFLEFDQNQIPKKILVETSNYSRVIILTKQYEFTTGKDRH